jgi:hemoglobin
MLAQTMEKYDRTAAGLTLESLDSGQKIAPVARYISQLSLVQRLLGEMGKQAAADATLEKTPYEMMGGEAAVRCLVDRFYDIMDSAPEAQNIRRMHANDLTPMRQLLFEFLSGWLGGPALYFRRPGNRCIRSAHHRFSIGEAERDQWLACMRRAMDDCGVSQNVRDMIDRPLARMCESFRNR